MVCISLYGVQIDKVCDSVVVIKSGLQFILHTCFTFSVSPQAVPCVSFDMIIILVGQ